MNWLTHCIRPFDLLMGGIFLFFAFMAWSLRGRKRP